MTAGAVRRLLAVLGVTAVLAPLAACTAGEQALTVDDAKAAELTGEQLVVLGGTPTASEIPDYTAADLVAFALTPQVVDPETCRDYAQSIAVPGQVVVASRDVESTDAIVVAPHLDLDPGFVEQAVRVLPDVAAAERLVADLRALSETCASFEYGSATNVNRFSTVETGDLPFEGDGFLSTLTVRGTKYVVETEDIYVMRFANVVATVRGTAGSTEPFAQTVAENIRSLD